MKFGFVVYLFCFYTSLDAHIDSFTTEKSIETQIYCGRIFKHSPIFKPVITENSLAAEVSYQWRSNKNPFHAYYNYPTIGIHIFGTQLGNTAIFGKGIGAMGSIQFHIIEQRQFSLIWKNAIGLGYLSRTFSDTTENNAIGSHLNILAQVQANALFYISKNLKAQLGVGVTHFSNGRTTLPNLGINFISFHSGVIYSLNAEKPFYKFKKIDAIRSLAKNVIVFGIGGSDKGNIINSVVLPTYSIQYARRFFTSPVNALLGGISLAYKNDDIDYNIYGFTNNSDISLNFGDEIFFGRFSFVPMLGIYLYPISSQSKYWYQKYSLNYQLPVSWNEIGLGIGAQLKTHYGAAELIEGKVFLTF